MSAYIDSSVVLALGLDERRRLSPEQWARLVADGAVSSRLLWVEVARRLDRLRLDDAASGSRRRQKIDQALESIDQAALDERVLELASAQMPTPVGALDAIHLATALLLRTADSDLSIVTHDGGLATAARAHGFRVVLGA